MFIASSNTRFYKNVSLNLACALMSANLRAGVHPRAQHPALPPLLWAAGGGADPGGDIGLMLGRLPAMPFAESAKTRRSGFF